MRMLAIPGPRLVVLLLAFCFAQAWGANRKPVEYDITRLTATPPAGGIPGDVTTIGGKKLELGLTWGPGQKVIFEDLMPGANWSHPAIYKVVAADGKVMQKVAANLPPDRLDQAKLLGEVEFGQSSEVEFKLNDFKGSLKIKDPSHYHAILINGHSDLRHWNDFSFLYRVLTQIYGYNPNQIHVADSVYKERKPDLDGSGIPRILYSSTITGVKEMIQKLKAQMTKEDHLVIAVNDHGSIVGGESTLILFDGEMKASEFGSLIKSLPNERVLSIFEQCFGGGFVRPTVASKRVSMAAASNSEYSWATSDLNFDEFLYHVVSAFAKQTHDGKPINNTDRSSDERVSAQQAFAYAVARDSAAESPLLESFSNSGMAPAIGLAF